VLTVGVRKILRVAFTATLAEQNRTERADSLNNQGVASELWSFFADPRHGKGSTIVGAAGAVVGVCLHEVGEWPELRVLLAGGSNALARNPFPFLPTVFLCVSLYVAAWLALGVLARCWQGVRLPTALRGLAPAFFPSFALLLVFSVYVTAQAAILVSVLLVFVPSATGGLIVLLFPRRPEATRRRLPKGVGAVVMALLAAAYVVTFFQLGLRQLYTMNVPFTDAGVFERMMWNTLHGKILQADERAYVFLGTRVRFLHFFLLPFYAVRPGLAMLMLLQTMTIALGSVPLYLAACRVFRSARMAVLVAAAYLLHPATEFLTIDVTGEVFRFGNFAPTFAMWGAYFMWRKRWRWAVAFGLLALSCREEYALLVAAVGVHLMVSRGRRGAGLACVLVGAAWFVLSIWVVIPYFRGHEFGGLAYYTSAGGFDFSRRMWFVCALLLPLGFLPVGNMGVAWMALPPLAVCLACRKPQVYSIQWHYHGAVMPFLFLAMPGAIGAAAQRLRAKATHRTRALAAVVCYVFACALASNVFFSRSPLSLSYHRHVPAYRRVDEQTYRLRLEALRRAQSLIPRSARVCATEFAATHFTHWREIYVYPNGIAKCDYVVGTTFEPWQAQPRGGPEALAAALARPIVFQSRGIFVLGRPSTTPMSTMR